MMHFFLATVISYMIYWISLASLRIFLFLKAEKLETDTPLSGFFPNLCAVGYIIGYGTFFIHATIFLALVVKHYLL